MTYQPLHHKYRPQTFADLVGQEAIAATLTSALAQQRIAPAYLFTGARGTGKTSSARILAKSLNCLDSPVPTAKPCGQCEVCLSIAGGSALDVIEIDAASNTGVDNIRELIERSQFAPVQCRYKVYVIDECHMLSTAAFNALLKTLEEPPDRVVFVLATTDPQRVLPTIISRCQRFDYRRIPLDAMVQHLRMIATQEQITIADAALTLVGQIAQGGLRDAESLLDQLSLIPDGVTVDKVWEFVGAVPEKDLLTLVQAIAADHPEALLDSARRLMDRGREPLIVLQNLASFYRDLLIAKTAPSRSDLVALTPATWTALCEFVQPLSVQTILAGQTHLRSAEFQLKHTTQPRLWLEVTLMGLLPSAIAPQAGTIPPLATQPARLPIAPPAASPVPPPAASPIAVSPPPPPPGRPAPIPTITVPAEIRPVVPSAIPDAEPPAPEDVAVPEAISPPHPVPPSPPHPALNLDTIWQSMLANLQPPSTKMLMGQQGGMLSVGHSEVRVGIVSQWHSNMKPRIANLEAAFAKALGRPVTVRLDVATPADFQAARAQADTTSAHPVTPPPVPENPSPSTSNNSPVNPPANSSSNSPDQPRSPDPRPVDPHDPPSDRPQSAGVPPAEIPPGMAPDPSPSESLEALPSLGYEDWVEDDVTRAAKQLAEFFGGKVVDVTEDEALTAAPLELDTTDLPDDPGSDRDDDDMPF